MLLQTTVIHPQSNPIQINNGNISKKPKNEYRLNHNVFDPSKSSPPNDFMMKLNERMLKYTIKQRGLSVDITEQSC